MTATEAPVSHPAKWSAPILETIGDALAVMLPPSEDARPVVCDPFAGRGLDELRKTVPWVDWVGVEIEREWQEQCEGVHLGDARSLTMFEDGALDGCCTSISYGNRMADQYDGRDGSRRMTYRLALGRPLTSGSTSAVQWGSEFRSLHRPAFAEMARVTRSGGPVLVNVSNHIRRGEVQHVMEWCCDALSACGLRMVRLVPITTARYKFGANHDARVAAEHLIVMVKP